MTCSIPFFLSFLITVEAYNRDMLVKCELNNEMTKQKKSQSSVLMSHEIKWYTKLTNLSSEENGITMELYKLRRMH